MKLSSAVFTPLVPLRFVSRATSPAERRAKLAFILRWLLRIPVCQAPAGNGSHVGQPCQTVWHDGPLRC